MIREVAMLRNVKDNRRKRKFSDAQCKERNNVGRTIFVFTWEPNAPARKDDQQVKVRDKTQMPKLASASLYLSLKDLPLLHL